MRLVFTIVPVEGDAMRRRPSITVGEYDEPEGERQCIERAHLVMAEHNVVEYVRVYHHHPERLTPRFLGIATRGSRRLSRVT